MLRVTFLVAAIAFAGTTAGGLSADDATRVDEEEASRALSRAVEYFRTHAGVQGGYVYRLSADLAKREGEGRVKPTTAWIQPPGTPAIGLSYLRAYQLSQRAFLLDAAVETGMALVRGQLHSGGWDNRIEFDPEDRLRYAYRVDGDSPEGRRNTTTFDDNKSQSALLFLMELDRELEFRDEAIHEAATYALESFLKAQYPNGAWPQRYSEFPDPDQFPVTKASLPESWSRTYPGRDYKSDYTLNDNTIRDMVTTMFHAWDVYGDERYRASAIRGGEFLLLAQLPEPQPGWAQQYNREMHPSWARKFEPPSITGGESQAVMLMLIELYRRTGEERFLEPLPRALEYYRSLLRPDGRLARFYEIGTDQPLYFTKDYRLTDSDADMPTHYGFIVSSKLDRIATLYERARERPAQTERRQPDIRRPRKSTALTKRTREVIDALNSQGAWVEEGRLRYHGEDDDTRQIISSETFAENIVTLAEFLAAR
ncbi:Pectic acid lyase [Maioricimonas rarisocia]|uniref:Pectic acid lyase n=1 Tax=Maioricimonas rarisocia TaxID=2528026 RepID=A0A517Z3A3_9PLAN|nr:pectate lyase [Maioricimonas rarisocia]QDU36907.1 Pectic acid lyase [Maioricimonas rarisocia]